MRVSQRNRWVVVSVVGARAAVGYIDPIHLSHPELPAQPHIVRDKTTGS